MTPTNPRSVPPHLREDLFRYYEPLITKAVNAWPQETSFTVPSDKAPTTFISNFRNALLSVRTFHWSTDLDLNKLFADPPVGMRNAFVIAQDETGLVWLRKKGTSGRFSIPRVVPAQRVEPSSYSVVPWRDSTQEEIHALCTLIHFARLSGPVVIDGPVGQEQIDSLTAQFNVAFVYDEAKKQTIIT